VAAGDVTGDGQPETGAPGGCRPGVVEAGEALENSLLVLERDARAVGSSVDVQLDKDFEVVGDKDDDPNDE